MIVYPAIDLKEGKAVRLYQGKMEQSTVFAEDPVAQACKFAEVLASQPQKNSSKGWIHLVNLNKAVAGDDTNDGVIRKIVRTLPSVKFQLGGGIRHLDHIKQALEGGVERVVVGTLAVQDPQLVAKAIQTYPHKIAIALDCLRGYVATEGWVKKTRHTPLELAQHFSSLPVAAFIHTDIAKDGTLTGPSPEAEKLARAINMPVIVSGGVSKLADITALRQKNLFEGVIVGRALYEGKFTLAAALQQALPQSLPQSTPPQSLSKKGGTVA